MLGSETINQIIAADTSGSLELADEIVSFAALDTHLKACLLSTHVFSCELGRQNRAHTKHNNYVFLEQYQAALCLMCQAGTCNIRLSKHLGHCRHELHQLCMPFGFETTWQQQSQALAQQQHYCWACNV